MFSVSNFWVIFVILVVSSNVSETNSESFSHSYSTQQTLQLSYEQRHYMVFPHSGHTKNSVPNFLIVVRSSKLFT